MSRRSERMRRPLRPTPIPQLLADDCVTTAQCADLLLQAILPATGAAAGAVFLVDDTAPSLNMVGYSGYSSEGIALWRRIPLSTPVPLAEAANDGVARFVRAPSQWMNGYPHIAASSGAERFVARTALPLRCLGRTIGVLGISYTKPQRFSTIQRAQLRKIADQAAVCLEQARITEQRRIVDDSVRFGITQESLAIVTDGKFILCGDERELPRPLPFAYDTVELVASTSLRDLRASVRDAIHWCGLPAEKTMDLLIAAGEAAMNAIVHGGGGMAEISGDATAGSVRVRITDHGKGIPLDIVPRAVLQRGYTTRGSLGHGFSMLLAAADRVWMTTGPRGTTVVMEQNRFSIDVRDSRDHWRKTAELWKSESDIVERNRRLSEAMALNSPDLMYIFDLIEQRNVFSNRELASLLGYAPNELSPLETSRLGSLLHPDEIAAMERFVRGRESLTDGSFSDIEYRVRRKDDTWCWLYSRETIFARDAGGRPTQVFGVTHDVTERRRIADALRERKAKLNAIFDGTLQFITLLTPEGMVVETNRAVLSFTGTARYDATGHPVANSLWKAFDAEDKARLRTAIVRAAAGEFVRWQAQFTAGDGAAKTIDFSLNPIRNGHGAIVYLLQEGRDISAQKTLESAREQIAAELRESERRLIEAQSIARIGSCEYDVAANRIFWSPETFQLLQFDPAAGEPDYGRLIQRYHPDDRAIHRSAVERALRFGDPYELDARVVYDDGEIRWMHAIGRTVRNEAGQIVRLTGTVQDVTVAKQLEEALRDRARSLREMLDAMPQIAALVGADGAILYFNQHWYRYTGLPAGETPGPMEWARFVHPEDLPGFLQAVLGRAQEGDAPFECPVRIRREDGEWRWHLHRCTPLRNPQGTVESWVSFSVDVHDQKTSLLAVEAEARRQSTIAGELQRALLGAPPKDRLPGMAVETIYRPAEDDLLVGGDFYDAFPLPGGHVALVVGDVTGKGLAAATRTAEAKFALRSLLWQFPENPQRALQLLNRQLFENVHMGDRADDPFVCLAVAIVHGGSGLVRFAVAGMEPPLLVRFGEPSDTIVIRSTGLPLGMMGHWEPENDPVEPIHWCHDRMLLLYSDGVTESRSDSKDGLAFYGWEGVRAAAERSLRSQHDPGETSRAIIAESLAFAGGRQQDDICLLAATRHPHDR